MVVFLLFDSYCLFSSTLPNAYKKGRKTLRFILTGFANTYINILPNSCIEANGKNFGESFAPFDSILREALPFSHPHSAAAPSEYRIWHGARSVLPENKPHREASAVRPQKARWRNRKQRLRPP